MNPKSETCSLYWIRFLKEINYKLDFVTVKVRIGTPKGIKAIKQTIEEKLFAEVANKSKILEAVIPSKLNYNKNAEVDSF